MVDKIAAAVQELPPNRFLVAITYTNAAANTIRERLSCRGSLRHNIFIGTTHSFVSRFILAPFAGLLSILPEDRIYAAVEVHDKGHGASKYTMNLINKGIVPYEAMIPKSCQILKKPGIRERICGRLAYIFVDEFQDIDIGMLEIIQHFRKAGKTVIYAVGDPEQYVMGFTYRGQKPPAHDKIPFFRFKKYSEPKLVIENHRSNVELVTFANQFRKELKQRAVKPSRDEPRVIFIPSTELKEIVREYQAISANVETEEKQRTRLYLSEENATFDSVCDQFRLSSISDLTRKNKTLLGESLELLSVALDRSQRKICVELGLSRLQWRVAGTRVLRELCTGAYDFDQFIGFISDAFGHTISKNRLKLIEESYRILSAEFTGDQSAHRFELCSSIRKAKGLEADAVLVVAKNVAELKKWLQTDRLCRVGDKQDKCRLGYVAFTRPREMLCIACLKEIDSELTQMLKTLGIEVTSYRPLFANNLWA